MNWRPEGWRTLKPINHPLHCFAPNACMGEAFEAGANAMLEALEPLIRRIAPSSKLMDILYPGDKNG